VRFRLLKGEPRWPSGGSGCGGGGCGGGGLQRLRLQACPGSRCFWRFVEDFGVKVLPLVPLVTRKAVQPYKDPEG
ncbi:rCG56882, partial [Rattus norvegicus]